MNKIKLIKKIFFSSLLILGLIKLPCHAVETKDNKYIFSSIESFFKLRGTNIGNQIYSPLGVSSCVVALTYTLNNQEKIKLETNLKNNGITNQELFYNDDNEANLQFFTTILTRYTIASTEKDKIEQAKIILGEKILSADANQQEKNRRNEFKQKIQQVLQQKFKGKQSLDYKDLWSSDSNLNVYLKIISALRFEAKWLDGVFEKIGKDTFTSFDNQNLTADYMKKKINSFINYDDTSGWESVRIFYENNYALDIILPQEETKYTNADKTQIIANLISKSNNQTHKSTVNLQMPLFKFNKKSSLTNMLKEMFPSFKNKNVKLEQECIIKVDEEGTVAEAITSMIMLFCSGPPLKEKEININRGFYYMISEVEETEVSFYSDYEIKNIIMIGAVNNPLLEN